MISRHAPSQGCFQTALTTPRTDTIFGVRWLDGACGRLRLGAGKRFLEPVLAPTGCQRWRQAATKESAVKPAHSKKPSGRLPNSSENPLSGGAEGVSLRGWSFRFGTTHLLLPKRGIWIFMFDGAPSSMRGSSVSRRKVNVISSPKGEGIDGVFLERQRFN
ncbi:MAG: hypothetical protein DMG05_06460 [Acidobacteria bacterium]|nr:MAG: hypothetical protein DMG05_06460 [Acidobacteriota bacterium]